MHHPTSRHEADASRVLPLPVTPVRALLPRSGLACRLSGDPALLRGKLAARRDDIEVERAADGRRSAAGCPLVETVRARNADVLILRPDADTVAVALTTADGTTATFLIKAAGAGRVRELQLIELSGTATAAPEGRA